MGGNKFGLQVSRQTPILDLSSTLAMIPVKSENREPMTFPAPACVKKQHGANFERTMTGPYHVFQNQFYRFSCFMRSVDTFRYEIEGNLNRCGTNCRAWTFSYYKKTVFWKKKKPTRTESCTTPNLAPRTSSSHLKNIHRIFLVSHWKKCSFITTKRKTIVERTYPGYRDW